MAYTYRSLKVVASELEDTLNSYAEQGWELDKQEIVIGSSPQSYNILLRRGTGENTANTINYDPNTGEVYGESQP
jgi:hypothetical protein